MVRTMHRYGKALIWQMSPNYRQNPGRFKAYSPFAFIPYVIFDYSRVLLDRLIGVVEHFFIGRREIPERELDEYVIRLLRSDLLNHKSIIYAFGVSRHIETEEMLAKKIGCTVYLFDPTEPAIEFMKAQLPDQKLVFIPIGVWVKSGTLKFYKDKRKWLKNLSVVNLYHNTEYVEAPCDTLAGIMKKHGHDRIDVLKMDIEGSALPVLEHMLSHTKLRPTQIVGALERPHVTYGASFGEIVNVIRRKGRLFAGLSKEGYRIITHHSAEFTAIRDRENNIKAAIE